MRDDHCADCGVNVHRLPAHYEYPAPWAGKGWVRILCLANGEGLPSKYRVEHDEVATV